MLQRWLLTLLLGEVAFYLWLTHHLDADGRTPWFIAGVILLIAFCWRMSHALGTFVVTGWLRFRDRRGMPLMPNLHAQHGEFTSRLTSYNWSQAFPHWALGADPAGARDGTPILLVHGYFSNRGMWIRFRQRLVAAGLGPVYTISLEPLTGSIDAMAANLGHRIDEICAETGKPKVVVVAHSMGGLVTRAYMAERGSQHIARLVTLGTPHHGTRTAGFAIGTCTRQMRIGSDWLQTLADREDARADERPPTLSIYTLNDDIVYPPETSALAWAENVPVSGVGHVGLLFSAPVAERVIEAIR
jgi:triacylglycerol esterase/lipase EstA (alpha/beta hydrolase family)